MKDSATRFGFGNINNSGNNDQENIADNGNDGQHRSGGFGRRNKPDAKKRSHGDKTLSAVLSAFGCISNGNASPELLAAQASIEDYVNKSKKYDDKCHITTKVVNGDIEKLPNARPVLLVAVSDFDSFTTAFTVVNTRTAAEMVRKQLRSHSCDNFINQVSRQVTRPDTIVEQLYFTDIVVGSDGDKCISVIDRLTTIVEEEVTRKHGASNFGVFHVGSIIKDIRLGRSSDDKSGMSDDQITSIIDALSDAVAAEVLVSRDVGVSFASMQARDKIFTVSISQTASDLYDPESGIAVPSNIQFVVQIGTNLSRGYGTDQTDGSVHTIGIQHGFAEFVYNPNFDKSRSVSRRDNPLFLPILTLTQTEASSAFSGMGDLIRGVCAKAITPEEIISAASPINVSREAKALRDVGMLGVFEEFGTKGQRLDPVPPDFMRAIIAASADEVRVRIMYDPANLREAVSQRDLFLSVYGGSASDHEDVIYSNLEKIFNVKINDRPAIGSASGFWYSGFADIGGSKVALSSFDMLAVLTTCANDGDVRYYSETPGALMYMDMDYKESLTEHFELIKRIQPHAVFSSIAFGIELSPEYLTTLMECTISVGFKVNVNSALRNDARSRNFNVSDRGFSSRQSRKPSDRRW